MRNSNLAYAEEMEVRRREAHRSEKKRWKQRKAIESRRKHKTIIAYTLLVSAAAAFMLSRYVEVYETKLTISDLQRELVEAESITYQKTFELENSVDLSTVEEIATTKLGMQRPEKYQTIYVDVQKEDTTEKTAKDVEGTAKKVRDTVQKIKENFIGIFTFN